MKYSKSLAFSELKNKVVRAPDWYTFNTEDVSTEDKDVLGWKLHLSLSAGNTEKAFNLVAPIIADYCQFFKVYNVDLYGDTVSNKQLTLYLENEDGSCIKAKQVKEMIERVTHILNQNNISPGTPLDSDAKLKHSKHFSLRNDSMKFGHFKTYRSAEKVDGNFNPTNANNPYADLLETNKSFDLKDYLLLSELNQPSLIYFSAPCKLFNVLLAYLNQYVDVNALLKANLDAPALTNEGFLAYCGKASLLCSEFLEIFDTKYIMNSSWNKDDLELALSYFSYILFVISTEKDHTTRLSLINSNQVNSLFARQISSIEDIFNTYKAKVESRLADEDNVIQENDRYMFFNPHSTNYLEMQGSIQEWKDFLLEKRQNLSLSN